MKTNEIQDETQAGKLARLLNLPGVMLANELQSRPRPEPATAGPEKKCEDGFFSDWRGTQSNATNQTKYLLWGGACRTPPGQPPRRLTHVDH